MSNNDSLVIQSSGEIISYRDLQSDLIVFNKEERQKVIKILCQIPAFLEVTKKLIEGKTYQAIFSPEGLKCLKDGSGTLDKKNNRLFGAWIRDVETGHFTDQASLIEVMPDLPSLLNQLATQQTLADIVHRLEVIDEKINDVLQGQFNDRLAEVKSGIDTYEQAIAASATDTRHGLLLIAIQQLNDGRRKLLESTDFSFIDKLKRNRLGMFFTRIRDIPEHVQSKADPVWKSAHAIAVSSRYLVLAYSALNEPDSLRVSLEQVKSEVKVFQDKLGEIVRWLPPESNWPESLAIISQGVLPNISDLDDIPQKIFIVEFQPKEFAPPEGV